MLENFRVRRPFRNNAAFQHAFNNQSSPIGGSPIGLGWSNQHLRFSLLWNCPDFDFDTKVRWLVLARYKRLGICWRTTKLDDF
jgi:hypothetical protein